MNSPQHSTRRTRCAERASASSSPFPPAATTLPRSALLSFRAPTTASSSTMLPHTALHSTASSGPIMWRSATRPSRARRAANPTACARCGLPIFDAAVVRDLCCQLFPLAARTQQTRMRRLSCRNHRRLRQCRLPWPISLPDTCTIFAPSSTSWPRKFRLWNPSHPSLLLPRLVVNLHPHRKHRQPLNQSHHRLYHQHQLC